MRGVNLGGWLVLEPWITPSIFQAYPNSQGIVDEYTLCQSLGTQACHDNVLKPHWDSWVQLADFQKIANSGFNLVRIPVGYWAYDNSNSPYASGAAPYIDQAITWARQVGVKVIIDLHGAPGSQNGFDNSGQRLGVPGSVPGSPQWQNGNNVQMTLNVLQTISQKYGASSYNDVIAGIEFLNEPLLSDLSFSEYEDFVRNAFNQLRETSQTVTAIVQDGFDSPAAYNGFLTPSDNNSQWVAIDHHEYQVFTNELVSMVPWQHRQYTCNNVGSYTGADKWSFIGEWSAAMTDCAAALNGYLIGARYDGTYPGSSYVGSCANINFMETWSADMISDTRAYIEAQMEVYEHYTNGWIFWNFKTEASPEWDAFRLIDAGIFPQPLTSRQFGQICTY
ncbi:glycoside hydrolase family 5 protein [Baudoinia panamericana UAMH 10762]|uniref:Glycoside hydrolase family 5 protein n=1 Tax=Baudoinia panamericana (strain UAMH 10762) TaxID=717646 RepID=M2NIK9_BAUPA|nr:glycoside hydrolase family 5 protein [Baudoinia panamericana UAMH 10762]EMC98930.1 glycoside hydrolase family 5 protein [Baudoinia panamericana UAMH 10762]